MVRPLQMAALLLFAHPLMDKNLLHLHPTYMTDLPTYLPQVPSKDCFSFRSEHLHYVSFPGAASGKEPICQCRLDLRDPGSIPVLGRPPEEGMTAHSSILAWGIQWTEAFTTLEFDFSLPFRPLWILTYSLASSAIYLKRCLLYFNKNFWVFSNGTFLRLLICCVTEMEVRSEVLKGSPPTWTSVTHI